MDGGMWVLHRASSQLYYGKAADLITDIEKQRVYTTNNCKSTNPRLDQGINIYSLLWKGVDFSNMVLSGHEPEVRLHLRSMPSKPSVPMASDQTQDGVVYVISRPPVSSCRTQKRFRCISNPWVTLPLLITTFPAGWSQTLLGVWNCSVVSIASSLPVILPLGCWRTGRVFVYSCLSLILSEETYSVLKCTSCLLQM